MGGSITVTGTFQGSKRITLIKAGGKREVFEFLSFFPPLLQKPKVIRPDFVLHTFELYLTRNSVSQNMCQII